MIILKIGSNSLLYNGNINLAFFITLPVDKFWVLYEKEWTKPLTLKNNSCYEPSLRCQRKTVLVACENKTDHEWTVGFINKDKTYRWSLFLLFSTKRADLRNSTAMAFLSMLHNADSHTPELHRTDWGVYHLRRVVDDVEEEPHLVSLFHVFGFFILVSPPLVVMLAKLDLFINLYKKKNRYCFFFLQIYLCVFQQKRRGKRERRCGQRGEKKGAKIIIFISKYVKRW